LSRVHLVLPDPHAHGDHNNDRADWVGKFMVDLKPDVFINLGDQWDLPAFSGYDKGKASFHGRAYRKDLDAGLEFSERLWAPFRKAKKKRPYSVFFEGNHEERMSRVLEQSSELEGTIGFKDFQLDKDYNDIVRYQGQTPGTLEVDGVTYAHYFIAGVSGRNVSGEHPGYSLITKNFKSCTAGHSHTFDYSVRAVDARKRIHGLVAGCFVDYQTDWAGAINDLWSRGLVVKRDVEDGNYDLQWISMEWLKKEYGK